jgi:galactose mutarotase-like enzyme
MAKGVAIGVEEENVLIQEGDCVLTILPSLGGKIASLRIQDRELLQTPLSPLGPRTRTMAFDDSDASGWDECLPSVAPCTVGTSAGLAAIPDHGDLWRVAWQPVATDSGSATFRGECFSLPLALERKICLYQQQERASDTWQLNLDYKLTNTGGYPVPWSWAAHPLFAAEANDRIVLPGSIGELQVEGSGGGRLGESGSRLAWPLATLANGKRTDLSVAQPSTSEVGDKLFTGQLAAVENWCALERPSAGVRIRVRFDPSATPYLGLWICYGGWPDRPGPKQACVALEPSTAPVDSLARSGPWSRTLSPGESASWPMHVDIEVL